MIRIRLFRGHPAFYQISVQRRIAESFWPLARNFHQPREHENMGMAFKAILETKILTSCDVKAPKNWSQRKAIMAVRFNLTNFLMLSCVIRFKVKSRSKSKNDNQVKSSSKIVRKNEKITFINWLIRKKRLRYLSHNLSRKINLKLYPFSKRRLQKRKWISWML